MREIVFRAWDGKRYSIGNPEYFDDSVNFRFHHFDIDCEKPILEQFTGLHDATKWEDLTDAERDEWINSGHTKENWKGRRIFEGDIVHIDNYDEGWDSVVEFNGGAFAVDIEGRDYDYTAIGWTEYQSIIIGNIHDNLKLLS